MKKRPLSGPFFSLWSRTRDCCNSSDSCDCFDNCDSFDCFDSFDSFCAGYKEPQRCDRYAYYHGRIHCEIHTIQYLHFCV